MFIGVHVSIDFPFSFWREQRPKSLTNRTLVVRPIDFSVAIGKKRGLWESHRQRKAFHWIQYSAEEVSLCDGFSGMC